MPEFEADSLDAPPGAAAAMPSATEPDIVEAGRAFATALLQAGFEAWRHLLGRGVIYTEGTTRSEPASAALAGLEGSVIVSTLALGGKREGRLHLVMPVAGAKSVVAYMLAFMMDVQADPDATELDEEGMDAYGEAINNFLGTGAQALRDSVVPDLNLKIESIRCVDFEASPPDMEFGATGWIHQDGRMTIEGLAPVEVHLLMPVSATGMRLQQGVESVSAAGAERSVDDREASDRNIDLALKMKVPAIVILAEKKVRMEVIQNFVPGSIIEFRKLSGDHLDLNIGNTKIAEGEVVIKNEHFGIQIRRLVDIRAALQAHAGR